MNNEILVNKERLIELLDHENSNVRRQSIRALESFFKGTSGVISSIIQSIDKYPQDSLSLAARVKSFTPNNEEISELIRLFNETDPKEDEESMNRSFHIQNSLLHFPFDILKRNEKVIRFNKKLSESFKTASSWNEIQSQNPEQLWNSLKNFCIKSSDKEMDKETSTMCLLLSMGLLRHKDQIKHKIVMHLSQEAEINYNFEDFLVSLSGDLQIEESVPFLFKLLKKTDFRYIVHTRCAASLGQIGGKGVVEYIKNDWDKYDLRPAYISILKRIPYGYAEEFLIQSLEDEHSKETITFLAGALCDMLSLNGATSVLDIVNSKNYDPQIANLLDHLEPVYIYHGETIDRLEALKEEQDEFIKSTREKDPLFQASRNLRETLNMIQNTQKKKKTSKEKAQKKAKKNVIKLKKKKKKKKKK